MAPFPQLFEPNVTTQFVSYGSGAWVNARAFGVVARIIKRPKAIDLQVLELKFSKFWIFEKLMSHSS